MGTPACIAVMNDKKEVTWTYVNYDGYLNGVGRMLIEHYNDLTIAKKLISMGDISTLKRTMDCPVGHSFATPAPNCTVFYERDRGEDNVKPRHGDYAMFLRCNKGTISYIYTDGQWHIVRETSKCGAIVDRHKLLVLGEVLSGLYDFSR